jgi:hypothetical protein
VLSAVRVTQPVHAVQSDPMPHVGSVSMVLVDVAPVSESSVPSLQ